MTGFKYNLMMIHKWLTFYWTTLYNILHRVPKKLSRFFLSELRQIFTDFDNFWQKDGKRSEYMRGALIFYLT